MWQPYKWHDELDEGMYWVRFEDGAVGVVPAVYRGLYDTTYDDDVCEWMYVDCEGQRLESIEPEAIAAVMPCMPPPADTNNCTEDETLRMAAERYRIQAVSTAVDLAYARENHRGAVEWAADCNARLLTVTRQLGDAQAEVRALRAHVALLEAGRWRKVMRLAERARGFASGFAAGMGWLR